MMIQKTDIEGVFEIVPNVHEDERGFFMETYREDAFREAGIDAVFVQDNHSRSELQNTIRGLNFQYKDPMGKIMRVTHGSAFLVAVDIRQGSPTFGKWVGIESSAANKKQLYAPGGFARGYQTLEPGTEVQYKCTAFFNPDAQGEILWNDPVIGIEWPLDGEPLLSPRNKNAPTFSQCLEQGQLEDFKL